MSWLKELVLEYQYLGKDGKLHLSRTPDQVENLKNIFADYPDTVMDVAIKAYILDNEYFPKPAQLRPYVLEAAESARGDGYGIDDTNEYVFNEHGVKFWIPATGKKHG